MAIKLRERYTNDVQTFPGLAQARAALRTWLETNDIDAHNNVLSLVTGYNLLWEIGGHSPVLGVDYQYRIELPGPINNATPGPQDRPSPPGSGL